VPRLLPHFKKNRRGKIINLSGGGATAPLPRLSAYAAAKSALVRLTETLAQETAGFGIDVNAVAPGALNTSFWTKFLKLVRGRSVKIFTTKQLNSKKKAAHLWKKLPACAFSSLRTRVTEYQASCSAPPGTHGATCRNTSANSRRPIFTH